MSEDAKTERARALFKDFHKRAARPGEIVRLESFTIPPVALLVGSCISIGYRAAGDGKDYYHEFAAELPRVFVDDTGEQAYIVGGGYRFTYRGFLK